MYKGLQQNIMSKNLILNLGLMYESLQELFKLSVDLQEHSMDLCRVDQKITGLANIFQERPVTPGPYY
jgi:hypothetical protein